MIRDDIMKLLQECGYGTLMDHPIMTENMMRFAALVAAEKDKEIELLRADAKRLDWCISVLYRQNGKDSYLVFDTGCGCCSDAKRFDCSISGRDAIDDAIRARDEV